MNIRHRDMVQFNWYNYAKKGFTETQKLKYSRGVRYYSNVVIATPRWADIDAVWDMFLFSRLMREEGIDMQTDHVVPINHPYVCGLHCVENLQHLSSAQNNKKSNHHWPDMWQEQHELQLQV